MKRAAALIAVAVAVATITATAAARTDGSLPLRQVARVPLSGAPVRFDYTSIDPTTHTLWISHMDASQLLAFNVVTRKITRTISAPGVHGVIAVPQLGRVYASATNAREVLTINSRTGKILASAPAGEYPDGLAYDPVQRHVFISDESGGVETVITASGQSNSIINRIRVPNCNNDHGLLIDSPHRIAFVACDGNAKLLTLNLRTMSFTGTFNVGSSFLATEAHTVAVDPATHLVYFPLRVGSWVA